MTQQTLTLADFLLSRIAEDEAQAQAMLSADYRREYRHSGSRAETWSNPDYSEEGISLSPERMIAECEAKRDLVREHVGFGGICGTCGVMTPDTGERWPCRTLRLLSFPYLDHPDYRDEWRP